MPVRRSVASWNSRISEYEKLDNGEEQVWEMMEMYFGIRCVCWEQITGEEGRGYFSKLLGDLRRWVRQREERARVEIRGCNDHFRYTVDLCGDQFGMLTAHPLTPIVSLHDLETVDPLYPGVNHTQALKHLFEASDVDRGRIFQHTVCYDASNLRTISVSWGYAVQVYEGNLLLPNLLSLQQTFTPWSRKHDASSVLYMFSTREFPRDPCRRLVIFFLESVLPSNDLIESSYKRHVSGNCHCGFNKNLQKIRIFSENFDLEIGQLLAHRRHCCDVLPSSSETIMEMDVRKCRDDELIAMKP